MPSNYKWNTDINDKTLPYVVVLFRSRNKDNVDVKDFKERKRAFFRTKNMDKIIRDFNHFIKEGVSGEMSRCYISLNSRDVNKVRKALLHTLIDEEDICFDYIEPKLAGIAAKKENALEKKWFFDFDMNSPSAVEAFCNDIKKYDETTNPVPIKTPNGYAVVVEHGFDIRKLFETWGGVCELKKDDLICERWGTA